jgi:hypothetical protein
MTMPTSDFSSRPETALTHLEPPRRPAKFRGGFDVGQRGDAREPRRF